MLNLFPIPAFNDNYIWAIGHPQHRSIVIVDPGDAAPVLATLKQQQLDLAAILITHHHFDHTGGIDALLSQYPVPVYGPQASVPQCDHPVAAGDTFTLDALPLTLKVLACPGHTLDHLAYVADGLLFCGDTLFAAGCGRLFEGSAEQMMSSLAQFTALPDDTQVFCAHEYTLDNLKFAHAVEPDNTIIQQRIQAVQQLRNDNQPSLPSNIGIEKQTNPFLRCAQATVRASAERMSGQFLDTPTEVFATIRHWKNSGNF